MKKELGNDIDALEQQLLDELNALKDTLEKKIALINTDLETLKAKDAELDAKIAALQTYVDSEIAACKDWSTATFATLQQYDQVQLTIAEIKQSIASITASIADIENNVLKKVTESLDAIVKNMRNELEAEYAARIEVLVGDITASYTQAILDAKADITQAYTQAIENAITNSETSMKAWVNATLADGYYDIAAVDAKLSALDAKLSGADADLLKQIQNQRTALEQTKADLTAAYTKAIKEAIEQNNGTITTAIAQAVQKAMEQVDVRLAVIENDIAVLQKEIENIKNQIATINQQITAILASIQELEQVDESLQQLIASLQSQVANLQSQLDANSSADAATKAQLEQQVANLTAQITSLQTKNTEIEQQISALQTYVNSQISQSKDWASATFATLEQYAQMQAELAALRALIGNNDHINPDDDNNNSNNGNIQDYMQALQEAISASETSMKAWVNNLLAQGYYDIATIDAKLSDLEGRLSGADEELQKQIENQRTALEQAKNELTSAYTEAIKEAIEQNNGVINATIELAIQNATSKLDAKIAAIENVIAIIQSEIEDIKNQISTINQQIAIILESLDNLEQVDEALQELINNLQSQVGSLQSQLDENFSADAATKAQLEQSINNLEILIQSLQSEDAELDQKIANLKNYVDTQISQTKDWASATFATLEQYLEMQTELTALKALVGNGSNNSDALEQLNQALESAISASETSMKAWVNNILAQGYYDIATIDAKLTALEDEMQGADAELLKQIQNQRTALEQAKDELTSAYKDAISEAIKQNNGAITATIEQAINSAINKVEIKLAVIENDLAIIKSDIESLKSQIATLNQQIVNILESLDDLEQVDEALLQLINNLQSQVTSLQTQLDDNASADAATKAQLEQSISNLETLIQSLQSEDAELDQKIANLRNYVDTQISHSKDWASATFATLEQYSQMQTELAAIKALVGNGSTNEDALEQLNQALETAISASETSMKAWVNNLLAQGYYDIATIDAKLAALKAELTNADTDLANQIAKQSAALEKAKQDITQAYTQAINEAIENFEGTITIKINTAVQAAKAELQAQIDAINSTLTNIQAQINNIANRIQSVTYLPQYTDGKVKFDYTTRTTEVYLRISPAALASQVQTSMVQAFARYTDDPTTRGLNDEFPLTVTIASGNATNGVLQVCLAENSANAFSNAFWQGDVEAIIYVQISDGNSNIVSQAIPVVAHGYVSGSNDINGFGDGESSSGTVQQ